MSEKDEIIFGAGELYLNEFTGNTIPEDEEIETPDFNVGHCSGGFSVDYKPEKYNVENQYGKILSWDLNKLALLSTAKISVDKENKKKILEFGGSNPTIKTVLLRFVHTKENGKKLRFTMIGQGGNGFAIEFTTKELTVDAQITAIEYIKGFLARIDEELTDDEVSALPESTKEGA